MKLYTNINSRGNTLLPLIAELGIEDQVEIVQVEYSDLNSAEYVALNPMAKVPFLVDGHAVVSETPAIFAYLADKFIEKGFAPALNDPARGEYLKWLFFCHGPLTEFMDMKSLGISSEQILERRRSLSFGTADHIYRFIEAGLKRANPYLTGERITSADLFLAYWLIFAISFKIIPYKEEFRSFIQLIQQREAVKNVGWIQAI